MTEEIDKAVWARAKAIFEAENRKDRVWGQATHNAKQAVAYTERPSPSSPINLPLSAAERSPYIDKARRELDAEK